ncbi:YsnF/AvaK domain-containing protein [Rathayibacter sp. ZW T2_19]|uniref:YsnF/AvaK domain-containing protein n=1 Tax=Rathayibacter rubneri TaxID=2950106 RepID=A0A9X2DXG2_9MICO|nr:YsnF/AvaK domain-containing protein [Rathayibacter rubneri]MCM6762353.1 YsnF/AvaK domain-containing protein [Rathayibacter rubneri]
MSTSPETPPSVVLHEERLEVSTRRFATERIRLERVVVTEQRTITVDVRREEIRLVREPLEGGEPLPAGGEHSPAEPIVVVLHEERIEIVRTIVPVERVTLRVASVAGELDVTEELRREVVDVERSDV